MKLVIIFGPPAVGKMTVGFELAELTGLKLFHNHMTIDLALNFFDFGDARFHKLVREFRRLIFEEVASSDLPGLIFTFVWAFDLESDRKYVKQICGIFREKGASVYFVELEADLEERLYRNQSEFRLAQKAPKRDVEKSKENLLHAHEKHKLNTDGDFFSEENYLKINNTDLSAGDAARMIVEKFDFSRG
jgi:hypothetical protein